LKASRMKKKVLIIDDSRFAVAIVRPRLERMGFEVIAAGEGGLGLRMVKEERPDLVILDLVLPGVSGENVCKEIRRDENIQGTPIIMLTAKAGEADRVIGRVIGADEYIAKPFDLEQLAAAVLRLTGEESRE
jgi:two-component system, OmpR family, alkaline phosphatase synthesis response regulator PhoP